MEVEEGKKSKEEGRGRGGEEWKWQRKKFF